MKLIRMENFCLNEFNKHRLNFNNDESEKEYLFSTFNYANLLLMDLEINMFLPHDKKGRYLNEESNYFGIYEIDLGRYIEAVQNTVFNDFIVTDYEKDNYISFNNGKIAIQYDYTKKSFSHNFKKVSDLCNLVDIKDNIL